VLFSTEDGNQINHISPNFFSSPRIFGHDDGAEQFTAARMPPHHHSLSLSLEDEAGEHQSL